MKSNSAKALLVLRRAAGLSRRALCREAGISIEVVRAIELGRIQITPEIADAIGGVLCSRRVSETEMSLLRAGSYQSADSDQTLRQIEHILEKIAESLSTGWYSDRPAAVLNKMSSLLDQILGVLREIARK